MVTCSKCRTVLPPAPFCSTCGASLLVGGVMPAIPPPPSARVRTSGMAITGFVLSFFCGVLGLIFSIIGLSECKKSNGKVSGDGLAIAGIVISVLSTIAVLLVWFAVTRFAAEVEHAIKEPEARRQLNRIADKAQRYYQERGEFPSMIAPLPAGSCCDQRRGKCDGDFSSPAWRALDYRPYGSQYFRYSYTGTPTTFEATAVGDLDCDGDPIVYRLEMRVRDGIVDYTIHEPTESD